MRDRGAVGMIVVDYQGSYPLVIMGPNDNAILFSSVSVTYKLWVLVSLEMANRTDCSISVLKVFSFLFYSKFLATKY